MGPYLCMSKGGQVGLGDGDLGVESGDKVAVLVCMVHAYRLTMTGYGHITAINGHF